MLFDQYVRTTGFLCIKMRPLGDFAVKNMLRWHNEVGEMSFQNVPSGIKHSAGTDSTAQNPLFLLSPKLFLCNNFSNSRFGRRTVGRVIYQNPVRCINHDLNQPKLLTFSIVFIQGHMFFYRLFQVLYSKLTVSVMLGVVQAFY